MTTIRKTQDLTNLRGLVMAEVSELDVMMSDILSIYFNSEENLNKFHSNVTTDREKTIHRQLEHSECKKDCVLSIRNAPASEVILNLDASQKARGVNLVLKNLAAQGRYLYTSPNGKGFMENYDTDIISMRNNLAHCKSVETEKDGKEILKTRKGDLFYSSESFVSIRKSIVGYQNLFESIIKQLKPQQVQ